MKKSVPFAISVLFGSLLTVSIPVFAQVKSGTPSAGQMREQLPVAFTENKGQVIDQNHRPRPDVLFGGSSNGLIFHLKRGGVSYQLERVDEWKTEIFDTKRGAILGAKLKDQIVKLPARTTVYRIDVNWVNANPNAELIREDQVGGEVNFFTNNTPGGITGVKTYEGLTYKNIYPGINLHYYSQSGHLKYDFIVAPNSNYRKIKLQINGAEKIELNAGGGITIKTPLGSIEEGEPIVYQGNKKLEARWEVKSNVLSLIIPNYDPAQELVIDPITRIWGTYYGTGAVDNMIGTTCDPSGNVYGVGATSTASGTNIATVGSNQSTYGGGTFDAFIAKFTTAGSRIWASYFGGADTDQGIEVACDNSGNVYMAGATTSTAAIATPSAYQTVNGGGVQDAFLAKFNSVGVLQWATYYGDVGNDNGYACAVDASGNVYLGGMTSSTVAAMVTAAGHQTVQGGSVDAFVVKFNSSGTRQWATFYGGGGDEQEVSLAADGTGTVYLGGSTGSLLTPSIIATAASQQSTAAGGFDSFLVQFNAATGARNWATYYGGSGDESNGYICVDASSNVYLSSNTTSSLGGIATLSGYQNTFGGGFTDAYLVKFNSSGVRQWATYYGGAGNESGVTTCAVDAAGNVYLGGSTNSLFGMATAGSYQTSLAGDQDAYLIQFSTNGSLLYGTYYGGLGNERTLDMAGDPSGSMYMCGNTFTSSSFPLGSTTGIASASGFQTSFGGDSDGFLTKFADCSALPTPTNTTPLADRTICSGRSTTLSATTTTGTLFWYNSPTSSFTLGSGPSYTTPNLSTGTYSYYVGAVNSCTASSRTLITVTVLTSPSVFANSGSICPGKSFTINPTGSAVTFTISGGSNVVSPSVTTQYTVTGTGANGCRNSGIGAISNVNVFNAPFIVVNSGMICSGSSFTMTPTGASTYTYSSGSSVVSPTATTAYSVSGTNAQGCVSAAPAIANVTVNPLPIISATSGTICSGQFYNIIPTGASTYTINGGSYYVNPSSTTSYSVTGTDVYGCVSASPAIASVVVNTVPVVSISGNSVVCGGTSATLTASGANTYTWSNASTGQSQTFTTIVSTLPYVLTATLTGESLAGCTSTAAIDVTVNARPLLNVGSGSICIGKSYTIIPTGANLYTLSSGANVVSPTTNTSYTITGMSSLGCPASNTVVSNVTVVPLPTVSIVSSATVCNSSQVTLTGSGASTYTWSNNQTTSVIAVSPSVTSNYTLTGRLAGCTNTAVLTVTVFPLPVVLISGPLGVCAGNSATLTGTGASSYSWSIGSGNSTVVVTPTATTIYSVVGTATNGCSSSASRTVAVNALPSLTVTGPSAVCPGASAILQAAGANSYTWSTGINGSIVFVTPTPTNPTSTYTVVASSAANCTVLATKQVSIHVLPAITSPQSLSVCAGSQAVLSGSGGLTYTWTGGVTDNVPFTPSSTQAYTVTGTDANGCNNKSTSTVVVNPLPTLTVNTTALRMCVGETVTLSAIGALSYTWSNGSPNDSIFVSPVLSNNYTVTGTDANGCRNSSTFNLLVQACTGLAERNGQDVFSLVPNPSSGRVVLTLSEANAEAKPELRVYNAIGQLILFTQVTGVETTIDLSKYDHGVYVVSLSTHSGTVNKRVIKE